MSSLHNCRQVRWTVILPALVLAGAAALLPACGYHTTGARTPKGQSIIIVPFTNRSTTFEVEQIITRALTRSFIDKSPYRIVNDRSQADVVMQGEIVNATATPVIYSRERETFGSAFLVTLSARVELQDRRTGKILFRNNNYVFREQYELNADVRNFFSELNPALERIAGDFASSVVMTVLEDF